MDQIKHDYYQYFFVDSPGHNIALNCFSIRWINCDFLTVLNSLDFLERSVGMYWFYYNVCLIA